MPRDYAQKPQPVRVQQSRVPRWVWLFTTSVVVLFVGGLFFLSQLPEDGEPMQFELPSLSDLLPAAPQQQPSTASAPPSTAPESEPTQPSRQAQLEFYTLLQQTDVFVPDEIVALRQREIIEDTSPEDLIPDRLPDSSAPDSAGSPGQFIIQVASFSSESDADSLRAQLILEGMTSAHVTPADLGDRGVFYRVMIGPVSSTSDTQRIGEQLENMGMQGLVRAHTP
ncbi:MAG: SPOR domain-containing protein [Natronospirillum sp.]|uniref:SPOR domain-containing protein n=1 Tax=Natronospirillum sp. TaxID=2812955 RepID=UPI0025EB727F|nr:SPOR domain-containing protein [Natronospirillum sp.]MCH8550417.1 SPOR domain-containing protein [Natronospirillum sp.]